MLTGDDIKKLMAVFTTKAELKLEIARLEEKMVTKDEFNSKFDGVMNKLDAVYGEVKDVRQEQKAHYAQHDRINERLERLESRPHTN